MNCRGEKKTASTNKTSQQGLTSVNPSRVILCPFHVFYVYVLYFQVSSGKKQQIKRGIENYNDNFSNATLDAVDEIERKNR